MHLLDALALFPIVCLSPAAQDAVSEEVMPRTRATMDDLVSWPDHLAKFGYFAVAGCVVLAILRTVTNRLLLPGMFVHAELVAGSKSDGRLVPI